MRMDVAKLWKFTGIPPAKLRSLARWNSHFICIPVRWFRGFDSCRFWCLLKSRFCHPACVKNNAVAFVFPYDARLGKAAHRSLKLLIAFSRNGRAPEANGDLVSAGDSGGI